MKITSIVFAALCLFISLQAQAAPPPAVIIDSELVTEGGFQNQPSSGNVSTPWLTEGNGVKTVVQNYGGNKKVVINSPAGEWNAITQVVPVEPGREYRVSAQMRTSDTVHDGFFGVRSVADNKVIGETKFGPVVPGDRPRRGARGEGKLREALFAPGMRLVQKTFKEFEPVSFSFQARPDQHEVRLFVGYWGVAGNSTLEVDDVSLKRYVRNPIGEVFRLKMWANITDSSDGVGDNTLECYGTLRINGRVWWNIDRSAAGAHQRRRGQTLDISEDVAARRRDFTMEYLYSDPAPHMELTIRDSDTTSADDDMAIYDNLFDLPLMAEGGKTWSLPVNRDGHPATHPAADLSFEFEHLGFIASSRRPNDTIRLHPLPLK